LHCHAERKSSDRLGRPFAACYRSLLRSAEGSQLGLASVGLSELYVEDAVAFLRRKGGDVLTKSPVAQFEINNNRVEAVELRSGERLEADCWFLRFRRRPL